MLKRSAHDLFMCPGFMLFTFEGGPHPEGGLTQDPPPTTVFTEPAHGLDLAKITQVYNALLQVCL